MGWIFLGAVVALVAIVLIRTLTLKPTPAKTLKLEFEKSERATKYGQQLAKIPGKLLMTGAGADPQHHGMQFRNIGSGGSRGHADAVPLKGGVFLYPPGVGLISPVLRVKERAKGDSAHIEVPCGNAVAAIQFA